MGRRYLTLYIFWWHQFCFICRGHWVFEIGGFGLSRSIKEGTYFS